MGPPLIHEVRLEPRQPALELPWATGLALLLFSRKVKPMQQI